MYNSSEKPLVVVVEPWAEDYTLVEHETLFFVAQGASEEHYFSIVVRASDEVLVYSEGPCERIVAFTEEGRRVEFGYNRHLIPSHPQGSEKPKGE